MSASRERILSVTGLTVYRAQNCVVEGVSFDLEAGRDIAIVGPNGAGKSSLVQAVLGILPRQAGEVRILGYPLTQSGRLPPQVRQQIAYLPQHFLVDRRLPITVGELVGLGWNRIGLSWPWANARTRNRAICEILSRLNAFHLKNKLVSGLSGGELKRVLLAYCLVRPRRLLILDEAPAGLDIKGETEFYQLLYQLKQEQDWAILQISHDLDMVQRHCDRVLCLNRSLRCQGVPEQALAPDQLAQVYGAGLVRYRHAH